MALGEKLARGLLWLTLCILFLCLVFLIAALADPNWLNASGYTGDGSTVTAGAWQLCFGSRCTSISCDDLGSGACGKFNAFRAMLVLSMVLSLALCITFGSVLGCMAWSDMLTAVKVTLGLLVLDMCFVLITFSLVVAINTSYLDGDGTLGPAFGLDVTSFVLQLIAIALLSVVIAMWPFAATLPTTTKNYQTDAQYTTNGATPQLPPRPASTTDSARFEQTDSLASPPYTAVQPAWNPYPRLGDPSVHSPYPPSQPQQSATVHSNITTSDSSLHPQQPQVSMYAGETARG